MEIVNPHERGAVTNRISQFVTAPFIQELKIYFLMGFNHCMGTRYLPGLINMPLFKWFIAPTTQQSSLCMNFSAS